ncbi:MAG: hypothetical protein WCF18_16330 [Chthoniobacteraceae bacterium]
MNALASTPGNLVINGRFLRGLWTRCVDLAEGSPITCPVWAQTFAADRWHVRYAASAGGEVAQARSDDTPDDLPVEGSLEIRGGEGVTETVLVGQNIEAADAANYRGTLRFSAWVFVSHPSQRECAAALVIGSPASANLFDATTQTVLRVTLDHLPANRWTHVGLALDANAFRPTGLRVELEFPPAFLAHPEAKIRLTDVHLSRISGGAPQERPAALERFLAQRFFQRHDGLAINAIGRALTCNPHELFFQFSFPEMRAFPACTLPQDNADLCVFSSEGQPQTGFAYDATYGARSSVIIRATKARHQLRDGYLAFRGYRGAILLDAEL